jgi:hypothetical protein
MFGGGGGGGFASKDCPVHNAPQPALLVHPFLPLRHQRFDGGLETGMETPAVATVFDLVAFEGST